MMMNTAIGEKNFGELQISKDIKLQELHKKQLLSGLDTILQNIGGLVLLQII